MMTIKSSSGKEINKYTNLVIFPRKGIIVGGSLLELI